MPLPTSIPPAETSLILASTSPYRSELLQRLRLAFRTEAPRVDETPLPLEPPAALASRLASAKANEVASRHPGATVIGSDQVLDLDGIPLGKPGTVAACRSQLQRLSGRTVRFHTAVAVAGRYGAMVSTRAETVCVTVRFLSLSDAEIAAYLRQEQPVDCAGAAKVESLGIALLDSVVCDDPTALIGLPLIATCRLLRAAGIDPLGAAAAEGRAP